MTRDEITVQYGAGVIDKVGKLKKRLAFSVAKGRYVTDLI
jgi:hypothetical protein